MLYLLLLIYLINQKTYKINFYFSKNKNILSIIIFKILYKNLKSLIIYKNNLIIKIKNIFYLFIIFIYLSNIFEDPKEEIDVPDFTDSRHEDQEQLWKGYSSPNWNEMERNSGGGGFGWFLVLLAFGAVCYMYFS